MNCSLFPKSQKPPSDLAKTRFIIGNTFKRQLEEYKEAKRTISDEITLKKKLAEIFPFPENIPEIAALFSHLSTESRPRKFRSNGRNKLGFGNIEIDNPAAFENLDYYSDFVFRPPAKRGKKVVNRICYK